MVSNDSGHIPCCRFVHMHAKKPDGIFVGGRQVHLQNLLL